MSRYNSHAAKRAAEDYTRVHHPDIDSDEDTNLNHSSTSVGYNDRPSKKPKFDLRNPSALAPDELERDAILDADVIGARGQQVRRGAVNIDGYDSDSDADTNNFDARAKAKHARSGVGMNGKGQDKTEMEEQEDMFADLEEEFADGDADNDDTLKRRDGGGKGKNVRFLDEDEIQGQDSTSRSGGHVAADFQAMAKGKKKVDNDVEESSDSEVDDAVRADHGDVDEEIGAGGKKSHAPKLDAFNMRDENDEGRFDDQGNYVRKAADPDGIHDVWMEGISKKEMRQAQEAHEKRELDRRKKNVEEDGKSDSAALEMLLPLLETGETVLEALARLNKGGKGRSKMKNGRTSKTTNGGEKDAEMGGVDEGEEKRKKAIETITEAADLLLARGQSDIYDQEKELLMRLYQRETGEAWQEQTTDTGNADSQWSYRWVDGRDGGAINGPYDQAMIKAWVDAGYFGELVEYQKEGSQEWIKEPGFV